jgi:glc operon protein GlcG
MSGEDTMRLTFAALSLCACVLMAAPASAEPAAPAAPPPAPAFLLGTPITLEQAKKVAAAAEAEATKRNMKMVIAVVEPNGSLVYFLRMDGAQYASVKIAQDKALSAALFGRPTRAFRERVAKGDLSPMALAGAVWSDGGVPIIVNGRVIGAVGSSGGADDAVSTAGAAALN